MSNESFPSEQKVTRELALLRQEVAELRAVQAMHQETKDGFEAIEQHPFGHGRHHYH